MHKIKAAALVGLLCLGAVVGCSTNTNPGTVNSTTVATLQLAVGSINDTADVLESQATGNPPGAAATFLDAIVTFRNQNGASAFIHPGFAELSPAAVGTCNFNTGAGCNAAGPFGSGLFAYGQNPGYNGTTTAPPAFGPLGSDTGYLLDMQLLDLPPLGAPGTAYTLKDQVVSNGAVQTYSAGATLDTPITILGTSGPGSYAPTAGTGGGTYTFGACPAGATEQVAVFLSAGPPGSVLAMAEGVCPATTAVVPPSTLAAGAYVCFVMAADFPWVEAGPKQNPAVGPPNPTIVGANGNADLSASGTTACTQT
ncbi:MAG: hypothetical protein JO219_08810 [Candidatus Eremiobacteraeota bacterium]|nr:hypothetical protein [Candidatus Eremiobacteraeota bacterium]